MRALPRPVLAHAPRIALDSVFRVSFASALIPARLAAMKVKAVVFDVGETIVDETRVWGLWADHLGVPRLTFFAALGAVIARGDQYPDVFELFRPGMDVGAEAARLAADGTSTLFSLEDLYPDALPAMRALIGRGYRLALAANQPTTAETVLHAIDVSFDLVATSESWGISKPDPAFFERIVAELRLKAGEIAYVGDRLDNDVKPAAAAGMVPVLVRRGPWGWILAGRHRPPEAALVIERLTDLPGALEALA